MKEPRKRKKWIQSGGGGTFLPVILTWTRKSDGIPTEDLIITRDNGKLHPRMCCERKKLEPGESSKGTPEKPWTLGLSKCSLTRDSTSVRDDLDISSRAGSETRWSRRHHGLPSLLFAFSLSCILGASNVHLSTHARRGFWIHYTVSGSGDHQNTHPLSESSLGHMRDVTCEAYGTLLFRIWRKSSRLNPIQYEEMRICLRLCRISWA